MENSVGAYECSTYQPPPPILGVGVEVPGNLAATSNMLARTDSSRSVASGSSMVVSAGYSSKESAHNHILSIFIYIHLFTF